MQHELDKISVRGQYTQREGIADVGPELPFAAVKYPHELSIILLVPGVE